MELRLLLLVSHCCLFTPSIRARAVICEALGVHSDKTNGALEYVLMLFDMLVTPFAGVVVHQWTGPFILVNSKVSGMEVKIAVLTVLGDHFWHGAEAISALNCIVCDVTTITHNGFPRVIYQRLIGGRAGHAAPRVRCSVRICDFLKLGIDLGAEFRSDLLDGVNGEVAVCTKLTS